MSEIICKPRWTYVRIMFLKAGRQEDEEGGSSGFSQEFTMGKKFHFTILTHCFCLYYYVVYSVFVHETSIPKSGIYSKRHPKS